MSDDEKTMIKDVLKSEGWKLIVGAILPNAEGYRKMATQEPESITDSKRTWFSGKAEGVEEVFININALVE